MSIGKEVYTNVSETFTLSGLIPNYLQKRIKGMQTSGIWEWWNKIVERRHLFHVNEKDALQLMKPTMAGNVLVIFGLYLTGMLIAIVRFFFESGRKLVRCLMKLRYSFSVSVSLFENVNEAIERSFGHPDYNWEISVVVHRPWEEVKIQ